MNFSEVRGQQHAIRAIEVALTGNHNLVLIGEPGGGKTTLATATMALREANPLVIFDGRAPTHSFLSDSLMPTITTTTPCLCGWHLSDERECTCSPGNIKVHMAEINAIQHSVDMWVGLSSLGFDQILDSRPGENSEAIGERITLARKRVDGVDKKLDQTAADLLRSAYVQFRLSVGETFRAMDVARTIAALADEEIIGALHIAEAIQYRRRNG